MILEAIAFNTIIYQSPTRKKKVARKNDPLGTWSVGAWRGEEGNSDFFVINGTNSEKRAQSVAQRGAGGSQWRRWRRDQRPETSSMRAPQHKQGQFHEDPGSDKWSVYLRVKCSAAGGQAGGVKGRRSQAGGCSFRTARPAPRPPRLDVISLFAGFAF